MVGFYSLRIILTRSGVKSHDYFFLFNNVVKGRCGIYRDTKLRSLDLDQVISTRFTLKPIFSKFRVRKARENGPPNRSDFGKIRP